MLCNMAEDDYEGDIIVITNCHYKITFHNDTRNAVNVILHTLLHYAYQAWL